ncbi:hypothetical protein [Mucilaginibacter myungsuensis]|uniref:Uncharacterized protein n=1 Tax=Mucilaginibacter myungsuensis TaxID=649104 RepID=A0A929KU81_9SPHI|nr:hypothetical protein [Mucilaginibacter myungsuensis]MBE9660493.1 hypothetical protein [Mucilaginibacter myungsuensis]MDN3600537.1 hypothetical protein [Mucilaginibacter myungsuensis]
MRTPNKNAEPKISTSNEPIPRQRATDGETASTDHFTQLLEQEVSKAIRDKGYTSEDLDNLLNAES